MRATIRIRTFIQPKNKKPNTKRDAQTSSGSTRRQKTKMKLYKKELQQLNKQLNKINTNLEEINNSLKNIKDRM